MIKLIFKDDSQPSVRAFDKNTIIVGSNPAQADLVLANEILKETHVKITCTPHGCSIVNLANDPFVTLNGLPFGKKSLKNQDIIQIGSTQIRVEELHFSPQEDSSAKLLDTRISLPQVLDKALIQPPDFSEIKLNPYTDPYSEREIYGDDLDDFEKHFNDHLRNLNEQSLMEQSDIFFGEDFSSYDMEALMQRVEQLEEGNEGSKRIPENVNSHSAAQKHTTAQTETPVKESQPKTPPATKPTTRLTLKDYYFKDSDEEGENWGENSSLKKEAEMMSPKKWKLLFKIFLGFLMVAILVMGLLYLRVSDQSEEEEIKAAKGVADVAMALTYAQVKHTKPQNQNWSDPEFVKNNLTAVLASVYPSFACFDPQGQFLNCPYILRVYTSSDLSKFLVIAQAAPSVFQWIIPKASIVIESGAMEMRKITDLRTMNRLLVNSNNLDGVNAVEISQLVKQGELIPLAHLTSKDENEGFNLPKALAFIHPGAENLIYNAPRYYQLGQSILEKSLLLSDEASQENEITLFQQELASLSHFKDLVLYSSKGMQAAMQAQKALMNIVPNEKFIIAYLQFNSEGKVLNSHLLIDNAASEISNALKRENLSTENHPSKPAREESMSEEEKKHPIYLQAIALKHQRQEALTTISDQMKSLLNSHNREVQPSFADQFKALIIQYQQVSEELEQRIIEKISALHQEHSDVPIPQLMAYLKDAGLEGLSQEALNMLRYNEVKNQILTTAELDLQLKKIEESRSWAEFDQQVNEMAEMLKLESISDPERITAYQNAARLRVNKKLTDFLLTQKPTEEGLFSADNRTILDRILKTSWIYDQDAYEFYLSEFDLQAKGTGLTAEK